MLTLSAKVVRALTHHNVTKQVYSSVRDSWVECPPLAQSSEVLNFYTNTIKLPWHDRKKVPNLGNCIAKTPIFMRVKRVALSEGKQAQMGEVPQNPNCKGV